MILGHNNGAFYKLGFHRLSDEIFNTLYLLPIKAFEIVCMDEKMIDDLFDFKFKKSFEIVSLHTPNLDYKNSKLTRRVLEKLIKIKEKFDLKNIVFHADEVIDWNILHEFKSLPISIENTDETRQFGNNLYDISSILEKYDFKLTLDVQHCFVNDQSMKLAADLYNKFSDRIAEFHLSGSSHIINHYPLFKTKQNIIIDFLKNKTQPIILESVYDNLNEAELEIEYVKNRLS